MLQLTRLQTQDSFLGLVSPSPIASKKILESEIEICSDLERELPLENLNASEKIFEEVKPNELKKAQLEPNTRFLNAYALTLGLGTLHTAWAMTTSDQLASTYQVFFGWNEDEKVFWNTVISSSSVFGLIIGSLLGGSLIS